MMNINKTIAEGRLMKHYKYLIIGGGLAGDAAFRGIRELDAEGSIGMFSMEPEPPYVRPNLSKGLWKGRQAIHIRQCHS